jgi:PTH1 family peptidyl-tRNA hydrolase
MKLFVGLGNPGDKYQHNRHNIGFLAVERIADRHGFAPWRKKFQSLVSEGTLGDERVLLLKPETFMNDSGRAVGEAMRFLKIEPADVYVFHDELDLVPGKVKVKTGGGNAGHNGLRSITAHIGNEYPRVRLGIGHPGSKDAVVHYVLGDFGKSERSVWVNDVLDAVADASPHLARGQDSRFLSDVALKLTPAKDEPDDKRSKTSKSSAVEDEVKPRKVPPAKHPAGERGNKRQSALAENLKKWLGARKSDE